MLFKYLLRSTVLIPEACDNANSNEEQSKESLDHFATDSHYIRCTDFIYATSATSVFLHMFPPAFHHALAYRWGLGSTATAAATPTALSLASFAALASFRFCAASLTSPSTTQRVSQACCSASVCMIDSRAPAEHSSHRQLSLQSLGRNRQGVGAGLGAVVFKEGELAVGQ